jgi:Kef-type K+ transport system membrane component KefB
LHRETSALLTPLLLLLGTSTLLITVFYRLRNTFLLAFLITGVLFGPTGFGIIDNPEELTAIADLGVIFLLFILGLFFITIGMLVNLRLLAEHWPYLLVSGMLLMFCKATLITSIVGFLGESWRFAVPAGMALAQGSQFMFALLALAARNALINNEVASNLITLVSVSMVLTPPGHPARARPGQQHLAASGPALIEPGRRQEHAC